MVITQPAEQKINFENQKCVWEQETLCDNAVKD